jgi:hypothetical protein
MSFLSHLHLPKGITDVIEELGAPETTVNDNTRTEVNANHRFLSFAGERPQNFVKW